MFNQQLISDEVYVVATGNNIRRTCKRPHFLGKWLQILCQTLSYYWNTVLRKDRRTGYGWRGEWMVDQLGCGFVCFWRNSPQLARASSFTRFLYHTQRSITVCRTPLDEWSARRRDPYLSAHNTHDRYPCPFEPTISAGELPQTYASDRAANGWADVGMWVGETLSKPIPSTKCGSMSWESLSLSLFTSANLRVTISKKDRSLLLIHSS